MRTASVVQDGQAGLIFLVASPRSMWALMLTVLVVLGNQVVLVPIVVFPHFTGRT